MTHKALREYAVGHWTRPLWGKAGEDILGPALRDRQEKRQPRFVRWGGVASHSQRESAGVGAMAWENVLCSGNINYSAVARQGKWSGMWGGGGMWGRLSVMDVMKKTLDFILQVTQRHQRVWNGEEAWSFPSSLLIDLTSHSMTALESWLELGQDSYASLSHIITLGQVSLRLSASVGGEGNEASQMDCCENEKYCVQNWVMPEACHSSG